MTAETMPFILHPGLLAAVIFFLGLIIIAIIPRNKWLAAAILLVLITPLATPGFWFSTGELGLSDWDYYFSYHHNLRRTVLEFNQFPLWNPWICGGTAALADPEFPVFAPTFLMELIFDIPIGFRLAIYLSLATTATGMLMLAKRLKLSVYAALIAALGVTFGSVNLLEIVEGHPNIFSVMWLPWVFWSWLTAYQKLQTQDQNASFKIENWHLFENWSAYKNFLVGHSPWPLITGIFLALTFFQGGIYLLSYTAPAFLLLVILTRRRLDALKVSLYSGLWALGITAIKLIPAINWLRQFQDTAYASSAYTLPYLDKILLGRYLHRAGDIIPNQGSGWHEYGAYIGPIVLIIAALSLFRLKNNIVKSLVISTAVAIFLSASGPFLKPIFDQLPFIPRSNISRTILFAVIPLSLLAAYGLDFLTRLFSLNSSFPPRRAVLPLSEGEIEEVQKGFMNRTKHLLNKSLPILILFFAAIDLFTLSAALSYQPFVLPDVVPGITLAPEPIAYTMLTYKTRHNGDDFNRSYAAARAGYGTLSYCSVLSPEPAIRTIHDEGDNDIISLSNKSANLQLINWSPNQVTVKVTSPDHTNVILNTNYARGWRVNNQPADIISNRVALKNLPAGEHQITFKYHPPGLLLGLIISISTILLAILIAVNSNKKSP